MTFQEKCLNILDERNTLIAYENDKSYHRKTLIMGLIGILVLVLIVGSIDLYKQYFPAKVDRTSVPEEVNILGHRWWLVPVTKGDTRAKIVSLDRVMATYNLDGYTDSEERVIAYRPEGSHVKQVLWHEIAHAVSYEKTGKEGSTYWTEPNHFAVGEGHSVVYNIGEFIDNFERANPDFMEYNDEN